MRFYIMDAFVEEDGSHATVIGDVCDDDFGVYTDAYYVDWILEALNAHDIWTRKMGQVAEQMPHVVPGSQNKQAPVRPKLAVVEKTDPTAA